MPFNTTEYPLMRPYPANMTNISVEFQNENSIDYEFLSLFIDYTSYIFYTSIFLLGITGNSIVIFVLLKPIVCGSKSNRDYFAYNNQLISNFQNSPSFTRATSRRRKNFQSTLMRSTTLNNNEDEIVVITSNEVQNNNTGYMESQGKSNQTSQLIPNSISLRKRSTFFSWKKVRFYLLNIFKEKLSVTNLYLFNLAFTDFLYLGTIPFLLCTIRFKTWIFGKYFCKLFFSLCYMCQCSIVSILVVLSIDRYLSVKYPHKVSSFRNTEIARIVIFIVWVISMLFIAPVAIYTKIRDDMQVGTEFCVTDWDEYWSFSNNSSDIARFLNTYITPLYAFQFYTFLLNYLLPVGIIVILYCNILRTLHKKSKIKKSKSKTKSHRKITRMVLCIIICYLCCWTPYWFLQCFNYFYQNVYKYESSLTHILISHLFQIIAYLSSALNPFIYSYMSEGFRNNLKIELNNCCCCWSDKASASRQPDFRYKSQILERARSLRNTARESLKRKSALQSEITSSTDQAQKPKILTTYFIDNKIKLDTSIRQSNQKMIKDIENLGENSTKENREKAAISQIEIRGETIPESELNLVITEGENTSVNNNRTNNVVTFNTNLDQFPTNTASSFINNNKISCTSPCLTKKNADTKICKNSKPFANDQIKTYIYRTQSNFVFAINFHSINTKKKLILGDRLRLMNGKGCKKNKNEPRMKQVKFKKLDEINQLKNEIEITPA